MEAVVPAVKKALKRVDPVQLHFLENCVACAACESVCPYTPISKLYSPVNKAEELRFMYRKVMTVSGRLLGPLVHAKIPKTEEELEWIREVAYRCTNCWHCYTVCPFGINSGSMISVLRTFVDSIGMTPTILKAFEQFEASGRFMENEGLARVWQQILDKASEAVGGDLPLDKKGAQVLYMPWLAEAMFVPDSVVNTIRILSKIGVDWTMPSKPLAIRPAVGSVTGNLEQKKTVLSAIDSYLKEFGAKTVLLSDGGFPYTDLRFELPGVVGRVPEYRVLHLAEFLVELLRQGKVKFKSGSDKVTWHDPCKLARASGVIPEPRILLREATTEFRELPHHGAESYCCGGGSGMGCMTRELHEAMGQLTGMKFELSERESNFIAKAEEAYLKSIERKMRDVKQSEAEIVVTACPVCVETIQRGASLYGPEVEVLHLATYLVERIEPA